MGAGGRPAIELEGGPKLRRALKKAGTRVDDLGNVHQDIAEDVADAAVRLVPHVSGQLGDTVTPSRGRTRASVTAGGRAAVYGPPIHFGWHARNIEPQPFLYDALDERREDVLQRYQDHLGAVVRRLDREAPS